LESLVEALKALQLALRLRYRLLTNNHGLATSVWSVDWFGGVELERFFTKVN
jgi:hypothetical protein